MTLAPAMLAAAAIGHIRGLMAEGWDFDLIDAHYYYPDGVAAALLARWLGKPFVVTARGTDINLVPRYPLARAMIRWAARRAAASITVCQALKDEMEALHVDGDKITVLRNGVDLLRFAPIPQSQARARLRVSGKVALCVGHLIERKGHHLAIEAMRDLPDWQLLLVGGGEMETQLRQLATRLGVQERVRFEGPVAQDSLCDYYSAADALILASSREGMANVLLEALACGTPVVATRVWGTPEVIAAPEAGELIESRDAAAIVQALKRLSQRHIRREDTRRYAEGFNWDATSQGLLELLSRVTLSGRLA
jgi:glycosyltransferase involved in cell wall biosynthesis